MKKKKFKLLTSIIVFSFLLMAVPNPAISQALSPTLEAQDKADKLPILDILMRVIKDAKGSITHVEVCLEISSADRKSHKQGCLPFGMGI